MKSVSKPLTNQEQSNLRAYLERDEFSILVKVIESRAMRLEVDCIEHLKIGTDSAKNEADALIKEVVSMKSALELLKKIKDEKLLTTITAIPKL